MSDKLCHYLHTCTCSQVTAQGRKHTHNEHHLRCTVSACIRIKYEPTFFLHNSFLFNRIKNISNVVLRQQINLMTAFVLKHVVYRMHVHRLSCQLSSTTYRLKEINGNVPALSYRMDSSNLLLHSIHNAVVLS